MWCFSESITIFGPLDKQSAEQIIAIGLITMKITLKFQIFAFPLFVKMFFFWAKIFKSLFILCHDVH